MGPGGISDWTANLGASMPNQPRRKDAGLSSNRGQWVQRQRGVNQVDIPAVDEPDNAIPVLEPSGLPGTHREGARCTAIEMINGPLAPFREALTLILNPPTNLWL